MIYDFVNKRNKNFITLHKNFLSKNLNLSWYYSLESFEIEKYTFQKNLDNDYSFIITENSNPIAFIPLFIKKEEENNYISWNDYYGYLIAPIFDEKLNKKQKQKVEKLCFDKIEGIVSKNKIKKIKMMIDPYSDKTDINFLKKYGFIDTSTTTCYVDLDNNLKNLWSDLRTSYKSLINKSIKEFKIEITDKFNTNQEAHNKYKEFHHKTAKRITRPLETWNIQYNMLKEDKAILIGLKKQNKYVAFGYFYHMNKSALYGSASDDPDFISHNSIHHLIIWQAIKYYKERNFNTLDLGFLDFKNQFWYEPSEKDLSISFFKKGFSSLNKTVFRGIKYYSKELLIGDLKKKKESLINNI